MRRGSWVGHGQTLRNSEREPVMQVTRTASSVLRRVLSSQFTAYCLREAADVHDAARFDDFNP